MKRLIFLMVTMSLFSSLAAQDIKKNANKIYLDSILELRKDKNTEFMTDKDSPLADEDKMTFLGLSYFPVNTQFKVTATLTRYDTPFHFNMKTTTDRLPEYAVYGKLQFKIRGKKMSLNVYQNVELLKKPGYQKYLFIPFNDATNGNETYKGGRFLDAEIPEGTTMTIDFNLSYNPYCAYNHKYSCPIPPEENKLPVRIEAGEKRWR